MIQIKDNRYNVSKMVAADALVLKTKLWQQKIHGKNVAADALMPMVRFGSRWPGANAKIVTADDLVHGITVIADDLVPMAHV